MQILKSSTSKGLPVAAFLFLVVYIGIDVNGLEKEFGKQFTNSDWEGTEVFFMRHLLSFQIMILYTGS